MKSPTQNFHQWFLANHIESRFPKVMQEAEQYDTTFKKPSCSPTQNEECLAMLARLFKPLPVEKAENVSMIVLIAMFLSWVCWNSGVGHSSNIWAYICLAYVVISMSAVLTVTISTLNESFVTKIDESLRSWRIIENILDTMIKNLFPGYNYDHRALENFSKERLSEMATSILIARASGVMVLVSCDDPIAEDERLFFKRLHAQFFRLGLIKKAKWDDYFNDAERALILPTRPKQL